MKGLIRLTTVSLVPVAMVKPNVTMGWGIYHWGPLQWAAQNLQELGTDIVHPTFFRYHQCEKAVGF